MKVLIIIIGVIAGGYYILTNHSPFQFEETDPHYVEIRVKVPDTSIELVGFGKMFSREDCLARSAKVWANVFAETGNLNLVKSSCSKTISSRYSKLFDNQQFHATYLVFDKKSKFERDGRFIIYGVPSSVVAKECSKIINMAKRNYSGNIFCVEGSVG